MSDDKNPPGNRRTIAIVSGHQSGKTMLARLAAAGVEARVEAEPVKARDAERRWAMPVFGGALRDAMKQMRHAEEALARSAGLPTELLGQDRGPLTGEELRRIMETPPDMSHIDRTAQTGGPSFHRKRRYTK